MCPTNINFPTNQQQNFIGSAHIQDNINSFHKTTPFNTNHLDLENAQTRQETADADTLKRAPQRGNASDQGGGGKGAFLPHHVQWNRGVSSVLIAQGLRGRTLSSKKKKV